MTSRTSFCNITILKKNLSRFWPFMALCAFIGFLLLPASVETYDNYSVFFSLYDVVSYILPLLILGYAAVCAVCVFGYLHKSRSSNMLHALPLTRSNLFVSNLLSGFLLFLLPWFAICLITLFIVASNGLHVGIVLITFAIGVMEFLFFYALAVFCMFLCGKTAYGVLTYLFLNFVVSFTEMLILTAVEPFLFGINVNTEWSTLSEFSPIVYFIENSILRLKSDDFTSFRYNFTVEYDWIYLGILSAVGVVLLALAWLLYRKRNMENVGEMVAYPCLRPVFRVVLAFFSALALGLLITAIIFSGGVSSENADGMHLAMLIGGFIGYFGVEMLLRKTTRVFQGKTFLRYGLFAVVLSLMLFAVRFDWLNIVGYVPESEHVTIRYGAVYSGLTERIDLQDAESIDAIRKLHQKIIDNRDTAETYASYSDSCPDYRMMLVYELENGDTVERSYLISGNSPVLVQQEIFEEFSEFIYNVQPTLSQIQSLKLCDTCKIHATKNTNNALFTLDSTHFDALRAAMMRDAREGTLWPSILNGPKAEIYRDSTGWYKHYVFGYELQAFPTTQEHEGTCFGPIFIPQSATHSYALLTEHLVESSNP